MLLIITGWNSCSVACDVTERHSQHPISRVLTTQRRSLIGHCFTCHGHPQTHREVVGHQLAAASSRIVVIFWQCTMESKHCIIAPAYRITLLQLISLWRAVVVYSYVCKQVISSRPITGEISDKTRIYRSRCTVDDGCDSISWWCELSGYHAEQQYEATEPWRSWRRNTCLRL